MHTVLFCAARCWLPIDCAESHDTPAGLELGACYVGAHGSHDQSKCVNRRIDPESGKIYDISDGGDLPDGVDAATLVQRADDKEDKVRARLEAFAKERDAVCGIFNDIVHTVDGNQCVALIARAQSPRLSRVRCARPFAFVRTGHPFLTCTSICLRVARVGSKTRSSRKSPPFWRASSHSQSTLCYMNFVRNDITVASSALASFRSHCILYAPATCGRGSLLISKH